MTFEEFTNIAEHALPLAEKLIAKDPAQKVIDNPDHAVKKRVIQMGLKARYDL